VLNFSERKVVQSDHRKFEKMESGNLFSMFFNYINSSPSNPVPQMETKTRKKDYTMSSSPSSKQGTPSKAQRLQSNHKMSAQEVGWFSVPQYSCLGYSYPHPQMEQTKHHSLSPSSPSCTQPVYNITTNCFEDLPVYQDHHQVHPQLWVGEMEGQQFLDCMEILVCEKSDQRLAAEILANSRLNPNAKEFTPKTVIENPSETRDTIVLSDGHNELIVEFDSLEDDPGSEQGEDPAEEPNCSCDIKIRIPHEESGSDGFSTEEEEEEDDDEDWWDSDEESTGECVIVDPAEFEDLFAPSLLINNLSACSHHPPSKPQTSNPRLREANQRFLQIYPDVEEEDDPEGSSKTVQFSTDPTIILEPESLAEELQLARIGEFAARQADRERMERLIGPILTQTHRQNIYQKIYGETLSNA